MIWVEKLAEELCSGDMIIRNVVPGTGKEFECDWPYGAFFVKHVGKSVDGRREYTVVPGYYINSDGTSQIYYQDNDVVTVAQ